MMKFVVLAAVVALAAAQMNPQAMLMMNMMRQQAASGAGGASGASGAAGKAGTSMASMSGMSRMFNNPMLLCRQTENFRPIPCGTMPAICDMISFNTYKYPGLMTCSPMGVGCCIKDIQSLMMINHLA